MGDCTLTRRALVGAAGAALAAGIPASAPAEAATPASDLDAEWSALLDRRQVAHAAWDATDAPLAEAMTRAEAAYPGRPQALCPVFGDLVRGVSAIRLGSGRERDADGSTRGFYTAADVEALRAAGPVTMHDEWDDEGRPLPGRPSPAGEARRREIVAAYDAWAAKRRAVDDWVGLTAASRAEEAAAEVYYEADDAVEAYQPRTLAGLLAKAAWVADRLSTSDGAGGLGLAFARQVAAFCRAS